MHHQFIKVLSWILVFWKVLTCCVRTWRGKARVAPVKRMTTPNLELLTATNGAKLAQFIKEEQKFSFDAIVYWTDSTTVLSWINSSESRHKIYIANRISIVLATSTVSQRRYVPTAMNPAYDTVLEEYRFQILYPSYDGSKNPNLFLKVQRLGQKDQKLHPNDQILVSLCARLTQSYRFKFLVNGLVSSKPLHFVIYCWTNTVASTID